LFRDTLIKAEKYFFILLAVLHILPVLLVGFFVTHDGPAHVYNASLIVRVFFHEANASQFLMLNPEAEPNWIGHFLMAIMNQFFSGNVSERILISAYVIFLPLAFRKFILVINPQAAWASYLIFPFIHSFLLYMGFYNFCLGLPVLFFTLAYWISSSHSLNPQKAVLLSFLLLLLYFSHLFVLALFFFAAAISIVVEFFPRNKAHILSAIKNMFRQTGILFAVSLPALVLTFNFMLKKTSEQVLGDGRSFSELIEWILIAQPLITFKREGEIIFAVVIAAVTGLLLLNLVYAVVREKYSPAGYLWMLFTLLIVIFYFLIPDNAVTGGFIAMRLLLVFYLFLFVCFAAAAIRPVLKNISVAVFISVSGYFLKYHYAVEKILSEDAKEYHSLTKEMNDNSVILPLFYSDNWMHNNIAAYLGASRGIFILDNYEPYKPHFPLIWKPGKAPSKIIGNLGSYAPCVDIDAFESTTKTRIDYITRWHYNLTLKDSCTMSINKMLANNFERIYVSPTGAAELFKRKK